MLKSFWCLFAAILIHFCIGGIYAWSEFVPELCSKFKLTLTQTQIVFGTVFGVFTTATLLGGKLLSIFGPRWVVTIGGILFSAGYLLASFSTCSFYTLMIYIGVLSGSGTGLCYVVPLTTAIKWFPKRKGFATGLVVAGFGSGSIFLSNASEMLSNNGVPVQDIFFYISIFYGFIIVSAAQLIANPQVLAHILNIQGDTQGRIRRLVRDRVFLAMLGGMFGGTFAGMLIIGNMKPIGVSLGNSSFMAMLGISAFALGNGFGRIMWGLLFDKYGSKTITWSVITSLSGCIMLICAKEGFLFLAAGALTGLGFGACFVLYAAQIATSYGSSNVAKIYPYVFICYGMSGVIAPFLGGFIMDSTASYKVALLICAAFLTVILPVTMSLTQRNRPAKKPEMRPVVPQ